MKNESFNGSDSWTNHASNLTEEEVSKLARYFQCIRASVNVIKTSSDPEEITLALKRIIKSIDYILPYDEDALNQVGMTKAKLPELRKNAVQKYKEMGTNAASQASPSAPVRASHNRDLGKSRSKHTQKKEKSFGQKIIQFFLKLVFWYLTLAFVGGIITCLVSGSIIGSVFAALFVALIIPIDRWQNKLRRFIKGKVKACTSIVLALLCFISLGISVGTDSDPTEPPAMKGEIQTEAYIETSEIETSSYDFTTVPTAIPSTEQVMVLPEPSLPMGSTFKIHFIDVGQADAALVECDNHYMLIDGGNKADSNVVYTVLKKAGVPKLDIVVGTHAHEDHIGGLPGAFNYTTADLTLCPVTYYDSNAFEDFVRYANQNGHGITVPSVGDTYALGSATIKILGVNGGSDTNDTSIVLRIDYGQTSFLFAGDAERDAEQAILNTGVDLSATVLKVGHHGSDTSTTYPFLREIMPEYAVISVGEGNSYSHPTEDTLSRLRDADVTVFRTDMQGDIFCVSDGKNVTMTVSQNTGADVLSGPMKVEAPTEAPTEKATVSAAQSEASARSYVANKNTKKFHETYCRHVNSIKASNRWDFYGSRTELINKGYDPCKVCRP